MGETAIGVTRTHATGVKWGDVKKSGYLSVSSWTTAPNMCPPYSVTGYALTCFAVTNYTIDWGGSFNLSKNWGE